MPINITLPGGRVLDVETPRGANYFISDPDGPFEYFTQNLPSMREAHERIDGRPGRRPAADERHQLEAMYATANALAGNADPATFLKIPRGEIEAYLDHITEQIAAKTANDAHWKRTGTLQHVHDKEMIYGAIEFFRHAIPCKVAFEKDFFGALSKFVAAAPPALASDDAESIVMMVTNAVIAVVFGGGSILPSSESAFRKLHSSGALEQYLRLSSSTACLNDNPGVLKFYDELLLCPAFIKSTFVAGQPCGDVAMQILSDDTIRQRAVVQKLSTIVAFTNLIQKQSGVPQSLQSLKEGIKMCRHCGKMEHTLEFQQSLQKCSRCKSPFYCSKECQRADWKKHKPICKPVSSSAVEANAFSENSVLNFCKSNYIAIMKEIVKVSEKTGKDKSDLALELDFAPPANGSSLAPPALKSPPEFKIAESRGYFEGSRPNEPDWFYKDVDRGVYNANMWALLPVWKDTYERLEDRHLLGIVRSPSGDTGCYRISLQTPDKNNMFSGMAVSAARSAIRYGDFGPLSRIFGEDSEEMRTLRRGLGGLPSMSEMDRVRLALNKSLGANFTLGE
ncbi:hypothetical protein ACHAWF_010279 [Thalassiosira exigua]